MLYGCVWILLCNVCGFFGRYKKPLTAEMDNFVQNWYHLNIHMLQTQGYRLESGFDLSFGLLSVFLALRMGSFPLEINLRNLFHRPEQDPLVGCFPLSSHKAIACF